MNTPLSGLSYLLAGFRLIFKPGIRRFVIIPMIINIGLFILTFIIFRHLIADFNQWLDHLLPRWLQWLNVILWLLFFISFFLVFIYSFVTVANVVAAPFNSLLAEKVESYLTGQQPVARGLMENVKDVPRTIGRQLAIIGYYLPRALLLIILFFIPVIQMVAAPLWFLFNGWYLALTYMDYPTDNHRVPVREVRAWMQARRLLSYGFGVSVLVATMIPVINFLAIPAAVAGATQCWLQETGRITRLTSAA